MLSIRNLTAAIGDTLILKGIDLHVGPGEVHAIMGPNGAGKSTLSQVLSGREGYTTTGEAVLDGVDLLALTPEDRAAAGLFLAFQYPVEIPGVGNMYFLLAALNAGRRRQGLPEVEARDFLQLAREQMALLDMDPALLTRAVHDGFSGGEKKRNEILQLAVLQPRLAILDEPDSGLDIDALRVVAAGIERLRSPDRSLLLITHYPRLLEHVVPDHVHVLQDGRIVRSGDRDLAFELEAHGYGEPAAVS
jgi:Fe-S cluster assembly ATP-binding protein